MTNLEPRLFDYDDSIRWLAGAMLGCTLPKVEWTHEAHLATCAWMVLERPDLLPERDLPGFIRRYNEAVGGTNDSTQGYHETITQTFIVGVRRSLARNASGSLCERVNALLRDPEGRRDWPLSFYSRELLFSAEARLRWASPDLANLPDARSD